MGLFSDAHLKAGRSLGATACEPYAPDGPAEAAPGQCDARIAPELETSLDVLWARLRSRQPHNAAAQGRVFCMAHWEPREGATTLALALAFRAAQVDANSTFCLVDFDLFHSGLSFALNLEAEPGVSNTLLQQAVIEQTLCATALPNLAVIPAGYPTVGRQVPQLYDRCQELCEILGERFHYVLLDMPSLRVHPSFAPWASGVAQAVLVVRAGQARRPAVAKALGTLQLMRFDVAGLILNAREYHVPQWLYART